MKDINRRKFLRNISAGMLGLSAFNPILTWSGREFAGSSPFHSQKNTGKLNVLFIAVDDLNDWIGALGGYPGVKTPNLDRLAERGVIFTRAYCSAPLCNPSRASLLTGIRPSTSGVYGNRQPFRKALPDAVTLPQHFMAHGYNVVGGGKIYHGRYPDPPSWHDYFYRPRDPVPPERPLNGIRNTSPQFDWGPIDVSDEDMSDYKVTQWGVDYLRRKHNEPFFLGVGIFRPHLPWYVPRKYFELYSLNDIILPIVKEDDLDDVPAIARRIARPKSDHRDVLRTNNWEKAVRSYLASINFADTCIGLLLDALDRSPYAENTVIVLWGDHGWHLGEKHSWRKYKLWEESNRTPLIIAAPGVTKPGGRCRRTVSLLDIYPTLVELCGLSPKSGLEGDSLVPLLKDPDAEWDRPVLMTRTRNNHAVRSERWRYIRYEDGSEELYDHWFDPLEWINLANKPQFVSVKEKLKTWLPKVNAPDAPLESR